MEFAQPFYVPGLQFTCYGIFFLFLSLQAVNNLFLAFDIFHYNLLFVYFTLVKTFCRF